MDATLLARKMAVNYYLTEMKKAKLVTPSIGRPYPANNANEEQRMIHASPLKIQFQRTLLLRQEINAIKNNGTRYCCETFNAEKAKFRRKVYMLKNKYNPVIQNPTHHRRKTNKTIKNRKARERYKARQVRQTLKHSLHE